MNQIVLSVSPVSLHQTMTIFDSKTNLSTSVTVFEMKDLEKTVFSVSNIGVITIVGSKTYTKRIEQKLKQYEMTTYGNNNIEYRLAEE